MDNYPIGSPVGLGGGELAQLKGITKLLDVPESTMVNIGKKTLSTRERTRDISIADVIKPDLI